MKKILNTLYLVTPERYLSLDGENIVVTADRVEISRMPLHNLERIVVFGSAGASPALMGKCVSEQRELVFMSRSGKFMARVEGEVNGNVLLRRTQYRVADDPEESLIIARHMIASKIFNGRWVLERMIREHGLRIDSEKFRQKSRYLQSSIQAAEKSTDVEALRGIEGEAASVYFSAFDDMILQQKADFHFTNRSKHPPLDCVNALLSFSYSLLTSMCSSALEAVGLDPYVGFMHADRPGRRSLALDLVEEFRAVMCDRFVLMLINRKMVSKQNFVIQENGAVILNDDGRQIFLTAWQKRKEEQITHPFLKEKIQWGILPYVQALLLARYLRRDLDAYPPFFWK